MKFSKTLVVVCASVSALSAFASADDQAQQVRQETRSAYTGNDVVVAVGQCSFPFRYTDLANNERIKAEFTVTTCKETKHYEANVTGHFWNSNEQAISGTDTFTYSMQNDTKVSDQPYNAGDAFQTFNVSNSCSQMREGFVQAMNAGAGRSKCQ